MPQIFASFGLRKKLLLMNALVAIPVLLITLFFVFPLVELQVRAGKEELTRSAVEVASSSIHAE